MIADPWNEDAQGLWQSQESIVTRMSADDMRARAERWDRAFRETHWIAFACAGVLLVFFVAMLFVNETSLQRVGAAIGIGAAVHLVHIGVRIVRGPWIEEGATCIRAYKRQLERRRLGEQGAARTILLSLTGCALLTSPGDWVPWTLQAAGQFATGVVVYIYLSRQARRFQQRIDELTRLETE